MIYNYPYYGSSAYKRNFLYNRNFIRSNPYVETETKKEVEEPVLLLEETKKDKEKEEEEDSRSSKDEPLFDFLGIKLYYDDLLIIGLLVFLYTEGVEDYWLFISLILLLIS